MTEQHYRMTLSDAIALYKSNDLTAKGALKIWVRIRFKENWSAFINTKEVRDIFDMRRSTFWEALGKLEEEGEIEFSEPHKIHIKRLSNSSEKPDNDRKTGQWPEKPDSGPKNRTVARKTGQWPEKPDEKPDEPASELDYSDPPDLSKSFQTFINSLSKKEREEFLKFGENRAGELKNPPVQLPQKWIEKNWEELSAKWYKSKGQTPPAQSAKWETDPRRDDWLAIIEETGNPLQFATDKEKQDFVRWCNETKQFSWLKGEL